MNAQARILKAHPLLSLLPRAAFNSLISHSTISECSKGTVIFRQGELCEGLYLLLSGRCESYRTLPHGHERVLGILVPGDTFGDRDLLFQGHYQQAVRVITNSVLLRVDGRELKKLLEEKIRMSSHHGAHSGNFLLQRELSERVLPSHLGRIVTMTLLSQGIPGLSIVESLARNLRTLTGESVLMIQLVSSDGKLSLKDWAQIQLALSSGFYFAEHLPRTDGGYNRLSLRVTGDPQERAFIAPLLSQLGRHFRYVLLYVEGDEIPVPSLAECMIQSDVSYLLLQQTSEDFSRYDHLNREVRLQSKAESIDVRPVVYVAGGERSREFHQRLTSGFPPSFTRQVHYLDDRNGGFNSDLRRLAREIGRCRIGLALSSGAARGLAHIGVIQVLEENGIEVDIVAGCSMGAYVGSVWAHGYDGQHMEKLARQVEGRWGLWHLLDIAFPPRRGFVYGEVIKRLLKQTIGDNHFCDMPRMLRIVATHLESLERVVFSSGEVAEAVHASGAIPGVCVPVTLNGETYIDGGIVDPLPVGVLHEMGIERIIAVNTIAPTEQRRYWLQKEREENNGHPMNFLKLLRRHFNYFDRGNILDVITRGFNAAQIRAAEEACQIADVVLRPIVNHCRANEFSTPGKFIAVGRQAAQDHLDELKALVSEKISVHEHNVAQNKVARAA